MATPRVKLHIEIPAESDVMVTELIKDFSSRTKTNFIQKAIKTMKKISDARKDGNRIIIIDKNGRHADIVVV